MSRIKDTDYLTISARLHALETRLLTRDRMERMIDAKDHAEAAKVLSECGYSEPSEWQRSAEDDALYGRGRCRAPQQETGGPVHLLK